MNKGCPVLFEILRSRGVSHRWLARQTGLHESTICRIAKGKRSVPPWFRAKAAAALQLPESILFMDDKAS